MDNANTALWRSFLTALILGAGIVLVAAVISGILSGLPGLWGALIGGAIGLIFPVSTIAVGYMSRRWSSQRQILLIPLQSLTKILLVALVLFLIMQYDFYNVYACVGTLAVTIIAALATETVTLLRARVPYIDDKEPSVHEFHEDIDRM